MAKRQYNKKLTNSDLIFLLFDGSEKADTLEDVCAKLGDWIIYNSAGLPSNFNKKSYNDKYHILYELNPIGLQTLYEEETEIDVILTWYADYEKELIDLLIDFLGETYNEYDDEDDYWIND